MNRIKYLQKEIKKERTKAFNNATGKKEIIALWEMDKRIKVPDCAKKKFCRGCRNNWYHSNVEGGCWSLGIAKLKKRKIYPTVNSTTPRTRVTLNCYMQDYRQ